ncbi:protein-lysine N-methyltransferase SMYD4-like isoform X1 [Styela clava]
MNMFEVEYDSYRGRYLTASEEIQAGTVIIHEHSFSAIIISKKTSDRFICCHCFKEIFTTPVQCFGCDDELYCSIACKLSSWKSHHWMECFMSSLLGKMTVELKLAFRIILVAAHSMFREENCESIHNVCKDMFQTGSTSKKQKQATLLKSCDENYWSIYSLQRHENEKAIKEQYLSMKNDIRMLTKVLLSIISLYNHLGDFTFPGKNIEHNIGNTFLYSLFKKLNFSSYYENPNFDIRLWKSHIMSSCDTAGSKKGYFPNRSIEDIFSGKPLTEQDLLERLLVHHLLQLRTNTQAIFKICEEKGVQGVQNIEQKRIASALFCKTSLMNHSCSPNTTISFDGLTITVSASKIIKKGEEICHCYGPHCSRHDVKERQRLLKEQYFFTCSCEGCASDLKDDSEQSSFKVQFHAFKCKYCGDPVKPGKDGSGTCINSNCNKVQDLRQSILSYKKCQSKIEETCSALNNGNCRNAKPKLLECLKQANKLLYHNHIDIGKLHDKIAQCFVMEGNYTSALPHLSKSMAIIGMLHGTRSIEMAHELQKLASLYFNMGNLNHAVTNAKKVISIYKICCPGTETMQPGFEDMVQIVKTLEK